METSSSQSNPKGEGIFTTTRWSMVVAAKQSQSEEARSALEVLCRTYWLPLYAYVRRQGHLRQEAEDLTQGFFARMLEKDYLVSVERSKGRFRSFLLASLRHYILDDYKYARRQKRGGGAETISLDIEYAEERLSSDQDQTGSPEIIFDRQWALAVTRSALEALADDYARLDKATLFETLKPFLMGSTQSESYSQTAESLGITQNALRVAISRLRQRYRELLRQEVAQTVAHPQDIDGEMRHLFQVISAQAKNLD